MEAQQYYLVLTLFLIAALFVLNLSYLYYLYLKGKRLEKKQRQLDAQSARVVKSAEDKAKTVIDKAVERARDTLLEAESFNQDILDKLEMSLRQTASEGLKLIREESTQIDKGYKALAGDIKQEYVEQADQTLQSIKATAARELEDFRQVLKQETTAEFKQVKEEIERYKQVKFREVDEAAKALVLRVSEEVLGKAISLDDHERLVIEALEKAKKEGVFGK